MSKELKFASTNQAIQYLSDLTQKRVKVVAEYKSASNKTASDEKQVEEYELSDLGVENGQYFQDVGTTHNTGSEKPAKWEDSFVGIGSSPYEATEDALDSAAQSGWNVENIENKLSKKNSVPEDSDVPMYYYNHYVVLYVK